jgi:hypothetical protein
MNCLSGENFENVTYSWDIRLGGRSGALKADLC